MKIVRMTDSEVRALIRLDRSLAEQRVVARFIDSARDVARALTALENAGRRARTAMLSLAAGLWEAR